MQLFSVVLLAFVCTTNAKDLKNLTLIAEWSSLDFAFPTPAIRQAAIRNGEFVPGNGVPVDVDVDYQVNDTSRIFISIPRIQTGIPATLGIVSTESGNIIQPYPDYSWHSSYGRKCDGITSVFRVTIDECRRLWLLYTGRIGDKQHCPPQLLVFNLENDLLIHRYQFPQNQYKEGISLFVTIVVDVKDPPTTGPCATTMAYIADAGGYSFVVYDAHSNRSWRAKHRLVYPNEEHGTIQIGDDLIYSIDGITGMALSPQRKSSDPQRSDRTLYFHALASFTECSVSLDALNNSTAWEQNVDATPRPMRKIGSRWNQSSAQGMDRNGNLFFGLMWRSAIACWDTDVSYSNVQEVVLNEETLQFSSGVKVILNKNGKEDLWVLSKLANETNFRIQALGVDELLNGEKCPHNIHTRTFPF